MSGAGPGFIPFLIQDNLDLSNVQTQQVIQAIDEDLEQLLRLPPQQFWHVVCSDGSLHTCLDSFLRFKRRCYDEEADSIQGSSDVLLQLSQRVFRVYWRMAHPQEQQASSAAAAAAAAAGGSKKPQQVPPSPSQVSDMLYNKWLVDVPKMMDLAVLYAPGSSQLVQQMLHQLLMLQPKYAQDIFKLSSVLTGNLHQLHESVKQLASKVLSAATDAASKQLLPECAEAVSYFLDACLTLQAFTECLPESAALLLNQQHHGELLIVLAAIYSSTLPLLHRVAQQPAAAAAVPGLAPARLMRLQHCLESLVFHLLRSAFCTRGGALASGGPAAVAAAAAATTGAPSSSNSSRKPPGGSDSGGVGFSAETQGQELMNLLMLLAHPSDGTHGAAAAKGNLLAAVNHEFHLDVAVSTAVSEGLLALDDAQFDYFLALVDGDRQLLQQRQQQQQQRWAQPPSNSGASSSTQAAADHSGSSSSRKQPSAAELASMVSSIKEVLPDYGEGFVAAALHHNSYSTEQTINCLLEGSLPAALQGLDTALKTWSPPAAPAAPAAAAATGPVSSSSSGLTWTGLAQEAAAAAAQPMAGRVQLPSMAAAAAAAAAAGAPKAGVDRRTSRVLGALSGKVRSMTRNIAQEMQFEYDDEYDDSFDDLTGPGNDGVCDIEGDDTGGKAGAGRAAAAAAGSAAAADEYADEPAAQGRQNAAGRGPQQHRVEPAAQGRQNAAGRGPQQQQQQQGRGRPQQQRKEKLWVLDGKVYNYKKEGATEVEGQAGAHAALRAAQQAAQEIDGLGPGGNVPLPVAEDRPKQQGGAAAAAAATAATNALGGGRGGGRGGQQHGGRGGQGGGRGRGRGSYAHKEQHKAAAANHHRRDRALQKQSKGML